MAKEKRSKNQIRRERAKLRRLDDKTVDATENRDSNDTNEIPNSKSVKPDRTDETIVGTSTNVDGKATNQDGQAGEKESEIKQETDPAKLELPSETPLFEQFQNVFDRFNPKKEDDKPADLVLIEQDNNGDNDDDIFSESDLSEPEETIPTISKHQLKKQNKVPLAVLKASTSNPQMIDWYDADAADPFLLISMKLQHNVVQVPEHWAAKRDYLTNRKGIERLPFELPKYIAETGISAMRGNTNEETLKQQQRARVQPKSGKLDIDYNKLHDAFFKFQSKPRLFGFGDIYFEGREDIDVISEEVLALKPGVVSSSLRKALGMPENDYKEPPPWLSIMNKLGKPPAYKSLVIPGLDVQYVNSGYREKGAKQVTNDEYWGKLQEYVESSEDEDEEIDEDEVEDAVVDIGDGSAAEDIDLEDEPDKVSIESYGKSYNSKKSIIDDKDKKLYTVVEESKAGGSLEGLLKSQFKYELDANKGEEKIENVEDEIKPKQSTKFKF